ncbi:hypothetical protein Y1Q_0017695 [Alligator mississippiensis]|uniref:Uncharacterized protein n=1 Tax=Alligator mississippiensis TaxID=8496 RepID=A0A151LYD0_ALLMI|nr:hypothetical protein Y1Q_0017695 [Alligator mississippiensis]
MVDMYGSFSLQNTSKRREQCLLMITGLQWKRTLKHQNWPENPGKRPLCPSGWQASLLLWAQGFVVGAITLGVIYSMYKDFVKSPLKTGTKK